MNRLSEDYNTSRVMFSPVQSSWQYRYDAYNKSSVVYPPVQSPWLHRSEANNTNRAPAHVSFQPNKPKWVNPNLRKRRVYDHTQGVPSLSLNDMSVRSRDWSERSMSVCSTSSQASNNITSIVPPPVFEPASSYEAETEFQELWRTL